ncbi:energy transducer TonB [Pontibacter pamirensis]|uniref:energy transducer TonB n=1 Tax=Pontibacter pamirensis TaxID=2562824 RepID=UPI00138978E1|nr:energy transducer TonB [Pontibacter pamirensis]
MKQILLLLLFLLASRLLSFAQQDNSNDYKALLINYNAAWQVTNPEAAVVKRLAYLPSALNKITDLRAPKFRYAVTDYYADNTVLARGHYDEQGKKWGQWTFYFPNGQVDCQGSFTANKPSGNWKFWTLDGKPLLEARFEEENMRLLSSWNEVGEQTVKNGNGIYTANFPAEGKVGFSKLEGMLIDGYQADKWHIINPQGQVEMEQTYGLEGKFLAGASYSNGKLKSKYTSGDKITILTVPDYMKMMEQLNPDPAFYELKYPVIADLMQCEVLKVNLKSSRGAAPEHYFKIIQKFDNGEIDTLDYGAPVVMPVFQKGLKDYYKYFTSNAKFPAELKTSKLEGIVVIGFTVTAQGNVENVKIIKGLSPLVDAEAVRLVSTMPGWRPATRLGKPVEMTMVLPFRFSNGGISIRE